MTMNVTFEESNQVLNVDFFEIHKIEGDRFSVGYDAGYSKGSNDGHVSGYKTGYDDGYKIGTSEGYEKGINRKNLYHKSGTVSSTQSGITVEYDAESQIYTLNGTVSSGTLLQLSNNMKLSWNVGEIYTLARFHVGGTLTLEGTSYLLWSIFTMNNSAFMGGRVTEKTENKNTDVLYCTGKAIESANNDGFRQYIQTLGSGNVIFDNYQVKLLIVAERESIKPWIPYIFE